MLDEAYDAISSCPPPHLRISATVIWKGFNNIVLRGFRFPTPSPKSWLPTLRTKTDFLLRHWWAVFWWHHKKWNGSGLIGTGCLCPHPVHVQCRRSTLISLTVFGVSQCDFHSRSSVSRSEYMLGRGDPFSTRNRESILSRSLPSFTFSSRFHGRLFLTTSHGVVLVVDSNAVLDPNNTNKVEY